jgi:hypothetical protein
VIRVAYVTGGTVGAGHVVRGLALQNALSRAGFRGAYAMFGPPLAYSLLSTPAYRETPMCAQDFKSAPKAESAPLTSRLLEFRPDLLIVDLFWGIGRHLLPLLRCESWLLVRSCPPSWLRGHGSAIFYPQLYSAIIRIEPCYCPVAHLSVDPVIIVNPNECKPTGALRSRLGSSNPRLSIVLHTGSPDEHATLNRVAPDEAVRLELDRDSGIFPAAQWLCDASEVYCSGGYNAFWESRWLGYSDRTRFVPFPRRIDNQAWRVEFCRNTPVRTNGADTIAHWIVTGTLGLPVHDL